MPNAGSLVSRYTSFPPPSTTRLRHNTGRGKFRKPRENAPTVAYAFAPNLAEPRRDRCLSSAAPGAVRAARARAAGGGRGRDEKGRERLAAEARRVGAWRGAGGGGRPRGCSMCCTYMPRDALWKKNGSGRETLKEEGEARRLETRGAGG